MTRTARWIVSVLVLVALGVVVADDVTTHDDVADGQVALGRSERARRRQAERLRQAQRDAEARALALTDEALAQEISRQEQLAAGGTRAPMLTAPAGVPNCRAADLRLFTSGALFIRLGNASGHPCALVDQPGIEGRDPGGAWVPVPVQYLDEASYSDGPPWTGSFDPQLVAVLSVRPEEASDGGVCRTGVTPTRHYSDLRLVLAGTSDRFGLPGVGLDIGPCRPSVRLWAYDTTDR